MDLTAWFLTPVAQQAFEKQLVHYTVISRARAGGDVGPGARRITFGGPLGPWVGVRCPLQGSLLSSLFSWSLGEWPWVVLLARGEGGREVSPTPGPLDAAGGVLQGCP